MESNRPPLWRLVVFLAALGLAAGAFGAFGLPRLPEAEAPREWRLAEAPRPPAPAERPRPCRHDEDRSVPRPFDYAR